MSHTPGPWKVMTGASFHDHSRIYSGDRFVANCRGAEAINQNISIKECQTNAALVAAAPEMLQALESILNDNRLMNAMNIDQAKAIMNAVRKAKGE